MYSIGTYFVEVLSESIPGDGWTANARFSRKLDYRQHAEVKTVTYPTHIVGPNKAQVERDVAAWARGFVASSGEVVESSLRLVEDDAPDAFLNAKARVT